LWQIKAVSLEERTWATNTKGHMKKYKGETESSTRKKLSLCEDIKGKEKKPKIGGTLPLKLTLTRIGP